MKKGFKNILFLLCVAALLLSACAKVQETVVERNEAVGEHNADGNYFEAQQIRDIEEWKDNPAKIVNVYILNPVTGGLLIPPVLCKGVPASSTESLEPNMGYPRGSSYSGWLVPLDGTDVITEEMTGRDGSFGDPVHFRQCLTVDGQYFDWPAYGLPYLVSSSAYTFPDSTVKPDTETNLRIRAAELILERGGCINFDTLQEVPCE